MMEKILASIYGLEYGEEITEQNHTANPTEELVAFCGEKSLIKDGENDWVTDQGRSYLCRVYPNSPQT